MDFLALSQPQIGQIHGTKISPRKPLSFTPFASYQKSELFSEKVVRLKGKFTKKKKKKMKVSLQTWFGVLSLSLKNVFFL